MNKNISLSKDNIRLITPEDDAIIADIIRVNLRKYHLDIPGTAYFDPELDHLSGYYNAYPDKRAYLIAVDNNGKIIGGVGFAEVETIEKCAEIQKLYLTDETKGLGMGKFMMDCAEELARSFGYERLYLETHNILKEAIDLYEYLGFKLIEKPEFVVHSSMDHFYLKEIV